MDVKLTDIINGVNVFNQTAPALSSLILSFKHPDGSVEVLTQLEQTAGQFDKNIADAQAVIDSHKKA